MSHTQHGPHTQHGSHTQSDVDPFLNTIYHKLNLLRKDPRMVRVEGHSTLTVRKTQVFEDTYAFFERYSDDDLKKYLRVTFDGRSGSWAFG